MDEVDPLFSWRLESWGNFDHDAFADPENLYDGLLAEMERDQRLRDVDYEELFETVEPHFSPFDDFPPRIPSPCEAFPLPFPTREDPAGLQLNSSGEWRRNRMSDVPFHVPPPTPTERSSKEVPKKHERDTRSCDDDDNNGKSLTLAPI